MSFFTNLISSRVPADNRLRKLNAIIDWEKIRKIITKKYRPNINPVTGVKPYDPICMFKAILLQSWHSLSDPALEEALRVRFDFILFTGFEIEDSIPDETTLCRFRNQLIELNLERDLFAEINRQLEEHGLKIKRASGAVIDATIIESAARPKYQIEEIVEDRKEPEVPPTSSFKVQRSCDVDARWLKKGKRSYFGYKMFISTQAEDGFIEHVAVTPANQSEVSYLPKILEGMELIRGKRIYGDKGYASAYNRENLKRLGLKDGLMEKATKGEALSHLKKIKNKLISKRRYIVEQTFGILKRRFSFSRSRYLSRRKVEGEAILKSICLNLMKSIRKTEIKPLICLNRLIEG